MNLHTPLYHYWKGVLPKELCDLIINLYDPIERTTGSIGIPAPGVKGKVMEQYRNSSVSGIGEPHWLYGIANYYMQLANQETFHYEIKSTQALQYSVYGEGQQYVWHRDSGNSPNQNGLIRKLSMSIQLDDPATYQGGEFQIKNFVDLLLEPEEFKPKGSIIVFPSMLLHRVAPVTQGVRRSLVAWFMGEPFR
ncbi:MAG: 2OG-Fe(II) oxygenase [Coleofasciculaceae cyanobacterium SM2_1_6]|nr:2OG-Fe(II) oxygenase [Coleofasciculaceae cyanobacterium SM2_1_6]